MIMSEPALSTDLNMVMEYGNEDEDQVFMPDEDEYVENVINSSNTNSNNVNSQENTAYITGRFSPAILKGSRPEHTFDSNGLVINVHNSQNGVQQQQEQQQQVRRFLPRVRHNACADLALECDNNSGNQNTQTGNHPNRKRANNDIRDDVVVEENEGVFLDYMVDDLNRNPLGGGERSDESPAFDLSCSEEDSNGLEHLPPRSSSPSKRVSFRCGENLVQVLEIPSRFDMINGIVDSAFATPCNLHRSQSDSSLLKHNSISSRLTNSARPRLLNSSIHTHSAVLLPKRPKTTNSRPLHDKHTLNKNRIVKKSKERSFSQKNSGSSSIETLRGMPVKGNSNSKLGTTSGFTNSNNFPKIKDNKSSSVVNFNTSLNINAKHLIDRKVDEEVSAKMTPHVTRLAFTTADNTQNKSYANSNQEVDNTVSMTDLQTMNDLENGFNRFAMGDSGTDGLNGVEFNKSEYNKRYMISREKMLAWHVANSNSLSELRTAPQIVPLWDQ